MTPFLMSVALMLAIFLNNTLEAIRQGIDLYAATFTALFGLVFIAILCGVAILLVTKSWPGKVKK